jgi:hypothetical protein
MVGNQVMRVRYVRTRRRSSRPVVHGQNRTTPWMPKIWRTSIPNQLFKKSICCHCQQPKWLGQSQGIAAGVTDDVEEISGVWYVAGALLLSHDHMQVRALDRLPYQPCSYPCACLDACVLSGSNPLEPIEEEEGHARWVRWIPGRTNRISSDTRPAIDL